MRSSGQDILLPERKKRSEPRSIFFEVSSTDRDRRTHKNTNDYRWHFPVPIKEVQQLRIIGGSIPKPIYNIDAPYNGFSMRIGMKRFDIIIAPGYYDAATLCEEITRQINAQNVPTQFLAAVDPVTGNFMLSRTQGTLMFSLLFETGSYIDIVDADTGGLLEPKSLATVLGFPPRQDVIDTGEGMIMSPLAVQLNDRINRIYLYLNYESSQDLTVIRRGMGHKSPSLIIYMDQGDAAVKFLNKETYDIFVLSAPAPISRIGWLDVSFRDEYYRPVNFNGRETSLLFEAVCYDY